MSPTAGSELSGSQAGQAAALKLQCALEVHSEISFYQLPGSSFIISVLDGASVARTRDILDHSLQISVDSLLLTLHAGSSMLPSPEGKEQIIACCLY